MLCVYRGVTCVTYTGTSNQLHIKKYYENIFFLLKLHFTAKNILV